MKSMKNILLAGMALTATVLASCSSDYLETAPTASVSTKDATATVENAYKALNGIAASMVSQQYAWSQGCAGENRVYVIYENYPSQDYIYNYYANGWKDIMNSQYNTRNNTSYDAYPFYYYYTLIGQANSIIANIDNATGEEAMRNFDKGSALTFRAYSYEKLLRYYAPSWDRSNNGAAEAFPLRIDESTGDLEPATMAQVYDQIYADCKEAIALFQSSDFDRPSNEIWIANENVAHAVYARAALAKKDYSTALAEAKLAREGYPLMSVADYHAGFCRPTSEWIFGSYGDASENQWYWSYGTQYACNGYYAGAAATGAGAMSRELYSQIPDEDARKAMFLTEDKFGNVDITSAANVQQTYGWYGLGTNAAGRTVVANAPLYLAVADYVEQYQAENTSSLPVAYDAGYFYVGGQLKFWVLDKPGIGYLPFIRSSEMVCIEAEANYFLGNTAAAQASLVELNATSGRNPNYTCSLTGDALWTEIMNYRELELWGEGSAMFDFKRWGRTISRHTLANGGNAHAAVAVSWTAAETERWQWVIPQYETDYNKAYDTGSETAE